MADPTDALIIENTCGVPAEVGIDALGGLVFEAGRDDEELLSIRLGAHEQEKLRRVLQGRDAMCVVEDERHGDFADVTRLSNGVVRVVGGGSSLVALELGPDHQQALLEFLQAQGAAAD